MVNRLSGYMPVNRSFPPDRSVKRDFLRPSRAGAVEEMAWHEQISCYEFVGTMRTRSALLSRASPAGRYGIAAVDKTDPISGTRLRG